MRPSRSTSIQRLPAGHHGTVDARRAVAVVMVVAGAASGAAGCGVAGREAGPPRPPEIERTFPNPGDQILSQGEVGAAVPQGWGFSLAVDGVAIPDEQLEKVPQLGDYRFKPRPGRIIESLRSGEHSARVEILPPGGGKPVTYTWSFRVTA